MDEKPAVEQSDSSGKDEPQFVDGADAERAQTDLEGEAANLSAEHREFLLARHGTLDLDPIPSPDPTDPYNWPAWKVLLFLLVGT